MENEEELRARFVKLYAAVPAKLREEIIALADNKPFNWNTAFIEINGKTKIGDTLLKQIVLIGLLARRRKPRKLSPPSLK